MKGMKKAGDELDKLGDGVKNGRVKSSAELERTFAKVDHRISACWHQTAEESKKSGKDAGADLTKAGAILAGAAKWSGIRLKAGAQASVAGLKKAGLATGEGVTTVRIRCTPRLRRLARGSRIWVTSSGIGLRQAPPNRDPIPIPIPLRLQPRHAFRFDSSTRSRLPRLSPILACQSAHSLFSLTNPPSPSSTQSKRRGIRFGSRCSSSRIPNCSRR